jgi:hypothetical protein
MCRCNALHVVAVLAVFSLCGASSVRGAEPSCEITNYGLIGATTEASRVPSEHTATGMYSQIQRGQLLERTAIVPARLGAQFGVLRTLSNIPEGEKAELVISHPQILTPSGQRLTRSVIPASPTSVANAYGLDQPYEVVTGEWTFEYFYHGKSLCRQTFYLVEPTAPR